MALNGQHNVIGYIKINGIPGESKDQQHSNWIEIVKMPPHTIKQIVSTTKSGAGGAAAAGMQHDDFTFTTYMDAAAPKLMAAASSGKHIDTAEVDLVRSDGGNKLVYCKYTFSDFMVSNVTTSHLNATEEGSGAAATFPEMEVSLNYGQVEVTYTPQKRQDGTGGGNVTAKMNLETGTVA